MSDNWNHPPGSDPADDQPDHPQEPVPGQVTPGQAAGGWFGSRDNEGPRSPGRGETRPGPGEGQSASWWTGDTDAKREFQNPGQSEAPADNWFDGGWDPNRREHPDQPAHPSQNHPAQNPTQNPTQNQSAHNQSGPHQPGSGRPAPDQPSSGRPRPNQSGSSQPNQFGSGQHGPAQHGPAQHGPAQHGPAQYSSGQPGSGHPGANQSWRGQPGQHQSGSDQSRAGQQGPQRPGPSQSGPGQSPVNQQGWQSTPGQQSNPDWSQSGSSQSGAGQGGGGSSWGTQSWTLQTGGAQAGDSGQRGSSDGADRQGGWSTGQSESSAWQASPSQQAPQQQTGPRSEGSYLWGPQGAQSEQQSSPWSNALPPQNQQQSGGRHAAPQSGQSGQIGPMGQPVQQAPTWQYPPIPIPQPPGGRRRRKKKLSRPLLIGLVVLAVLVVGSGITLIVRNLGGDDAEAKQTPTAPASQSSSQSPSQTPSSSPSQSTPRGPTVDEVVKGSRLYTIGPVAASKCAEPPFAPVTVPAAQQYYNRLLPCLNHTWWLAMKKANLPFRNPKAVVYVGKLSSPCGIQRSVRAAYCPGNETIYLPFSVDNAAYAKNPIFARAVMLNTFVHEYGHHVQKLSGILGASTTRQKTMTPNQQLTESRRRELQATCLGAVYLGADAAFVPMRGPLLANWKVLIAHMGDEYARPRVHDHGNRVSNYQWSITGFNNKKPDSCNTFTAADVRVN